MFRFLRMITAFNNELYLWTTPTMISLKMVSGRHSEGDMGISYLLESTGDFGNAYLNLYKDQYPEAIRQLYLRIIGETDV